MALSRDQLARLRFDSGVLEVVVGGQSAIDVQESLGIRSVEEAGGSSIAMASMSKTPSRRRSWAITRRP